MMAYLNDTMIDLQEYMDYSTTFDRVREKSDIAKELKERVANRLSGFGGDKMPWSGDSEKMKFRPSELTIWAGVNGQGKSLIMGQVILNFIEQGKKALVVSLEMPAASTLDRMLCQWTGRNSPNEYQIDEFLRWKMDHLYLFDFVGSIDQFKVVALCRYAKSIGCDHIIIDSLAKCTGAEDNYAEQKSIINSLAEVAKEVKIHVHLVHHARKGGDESKRINKFDVKGSGVLVDLADNLILVSRNKEKEAQTKITGIKDNTIPDQFLDVAKQRHGNWEGLIDLWFDTKTFTYSDSFMPNFYEGAI